LHLLTFKTIVVLISQGIVLVKIIMLLASHRLAIHITYIRKE